MRPLMLVRLLVEVLAVESAVYLALVRQIDELRNVLVESRHAGPAETAAARLDVAACFKSLPRQRRRIARVLALGESTAEVAKRFNLSAGVWSNYWNEV